MAADGLATEGARASEAILWTISPGMYQFQHQKGYIFYLIIYMYVSVFFEYR